MPDIEFHYDAPRCPKCKALYSGLTYVPNTDTLSYLLGCDCPAPSLIERRIQRKLEKKMTDPNRKAQKEAALNFKKEQHERAVEGIVFHPWPKIFRLQREIIITEKIDGTNAAIGVTELGEVYAQSRNRLISVFDDNSGFAQWVEHNKDVLRDTLGPGLHFGEWWGVGIQSGYGLSERRFSLFNSWQWGIDELGKTRLELARKLGVAIYVVPILYQGPWQIDNGYGFVFAPEGVLNQLKEFGSQAAKGYMKPEGIIVFHTASGQMFKMTLDGDGHKGVR